VTWQWPKTDALRRSPSGSRHAATPYYSCNATCRIRNAAATRREPNEHRRQVHRSMISAELVIHYKEQS